MFGCWRYAGDQLSPRHLDMGGVADREDVRMSRDCEIRFYENAAGTIGRRVEPLGRRRRRDPGSPENGFRRETMAVEFHPSIRAFSDRLSKFDFDAEVP